jgi:hypothetical protein
MALWLAGSAAACHHFFRESIRSSRTCEIGMTRATGQVYRSYMYLLEKATR